MREAVIVASSRTALAKSFRGSFNLTRPEELAAHCIQDVLRKTPQLDPREVEDVDPGLRTAPWPAGTQYCAELPPCWPGCLVRPAASPSTAFALPGLQSIALAAYQIVNGGSDAA